MDWVFLEIRNATSPYAIQASKRALVQRDGDIVDVDGVSLESVGGKLTAKLTLVANQTRTLKGMVLS